MGRAFLLPVVLAGLAFTGPARAAEDHTAATDRVWRCGPDGRVYQAAPCPRGAVVEVADRVEPSRRQQADRVVQRERSGLARLAAERRAREASSRGQLPGSIKPQARAGSAPAAKAASSRGNKARRRPPA